jgi:hypothetical protein
MLADGYRESNAALVIEKNITDSLLNTMSTSMYGIAIIALAARGESRGENDFSWW